jgi:hypothetical protein
MLQTLDSPSEACLNPIVCSYTNHTGTLQIARISNILGWYYERVVFPGQHLLFEAPAMGILEIYTGSFASSILSEQIPCQDLNTDPNKHWIPKQQLTVTAS